MAKIVNTTDSFAEDYDGFIALHLGAGKHRANLKPIYKRISLEACSKALKVLRAERSVTKAVMEATVSLETSGVVNAGTGSALNSDGAVQCDASIMDGRTMAFGGVGCVSGIPNPTQVAYEILRNCNNRHGLGLISPILLVGDGARHFATRNGIRNVSPQSLISEKSLKKFNNIKEKVHSFADKTAINKIINNPEEIQDTIGVICVDSLGHIAAAASSGGSQFKTPGRIGQSAVYGAGCWACISSHEGDDCSIAATTSGIGEQIIRTNLAKQLCDKILLKQDLHEALQETFIETFLRSPVLACYERKLAGALSLTYYPSSKIGTLSWAYNTADMVVAYQSTQDSKMHYRLSKHLDAMITQSPSIQVEQTAYPTIVGAKATSCALVYNIFSQW